MWACRTLHCFILIIPFPIRVFTFGTKCPTFTFIAAPVNSFTRDLGLTWEDRLPDVPPFPFNLCLTVLKQLAKALCVDENVVYSDSRRIYMLYVMVNFFRKLNIAIFLRHKPHIVNAFKAKWRNHAGVGKAFKCR